MKISVIIATHDRKALLRECLESILGQHFHETEIIVVDDASSDGTGSMVQAEYPDVVYVRNDVNLLNGKTRRRGFDVATGDVVIFLDDDDLLSGPGYFRALENAFADSAVVMACAATEIREERSGKSVLSFPRWPERTSTRTLLNGFGSKYPKPVSTVGLALRMSALKDAGFANMEWVEDMGIYLRALLAPGTVLRLGTVAGVYRKHSGSDRYSRSAKSLVPVQREKSRIYREALSRGLLDNPSQWRSRQMSATPRFFLSCSNSRRNLFSDLFILGLFLRDARTFADFKTAAVFAFWISVRTVRRLFRKREASK